MVKLKKEHLSIGKRVRSRIIIIFTAFLMLLMVSATSPRASAELVLLDEVNIGDPICEGNHVLSGWGILRQGPASGWGGWDVDDNTNSPHNLRTVWDPGQTQGDENWATVILNANTNARLLEIRHLDGQADDGFEVYINDKLVYSYLNDPSNSEYWLTTEIPLKIGGELVVKIVATGDPWSGINTYGQLAINYMKIYGVGGFDMYGYNYNSRIFVGAYDGVDRYLDGLCWGDATYADDLLVMKWSKAWDDARFHGAEWTPDAWCTNHGVGEYERDGQFYKYTYFVKIVWVGDYPDNEYPIWGQFEVVEEVLNDPGEGTNGVIYKSQPGLGSVENWIY
ncbi:MAG TPA: hypothetical protein ENN25_05205 [Euryarchaeota archaeon]|nr:hypothetical protein [Euryarchaeota archaeon]